MSLTQRDVLNPAMSLPQMGEMGDSPGCGNGRHDANQQTAVLLLDLGMPDGPDEASVRKYIAKVLSDPEVVRLPRGLRWANPVIGQVLSLIQSEKWGERYRRIWGEDGPPVASINKAQASALEAKLPEGMSVFHAMRYGRPGVEEVLKKIEGLGIEAVIAVSMYPQHSATGGVTAIRELLRQIDRLGCGLEVTVRNQWYDDAGYINAQARLIHEFAAAHGLGPDNTHLVYSLRPVPISSVDRGDPYMDHIHRTAELVSRRLGWPADQISIGYQGHPGSPRWLRPAMAEVIEDLSERGEKQILVCPLGFTTDCLETLEAIGVRFRERFERGGGRFWACEALNASEPFIAALRNIVLRGRYPVSFPKSHIGLITNVCKGGESMEPVESPVESLFMVGMTLGGRLRPSRGPAMARVDVETMRSVKKTQCEIPELLRVVCQDGSVREAWLWNTCRRFELFGWLKEPCDEADRARVVGEIGGRVFSLNGSTDSGGLNILHGRDAWHYLMRTAAGLNSGLPGESEILQQLHAAHRLAERAGTAGPLTEGLISEVSGRETELRERTEWGQFRSNYCYASISQLVQSTGLDLQSGRCVVIGGSTTSCGILDALSDRFGASRRQMTLLHRGHGSGVHLKMLRKAIGDGRRVRVHKYGQKSVIEEIAGADVVFIGLDRKEPVLEAAQIRDCRDFGVRPLVIVDFNMFGSTVGMESLEGVRVHDAEGLEAAAAAFAEEMCDSAQFGAAVHAAEGWIEDRVPSPGAMMGRS